eukprot:IDg1827t1
MCGSEHDPNGFSAQYSESRYRRSSKVRSSFDLGSVSKHSHALPDSVEAEKMATGNFISHVAYHDYPQYLQAQ